MRVVLADDSVLLREGVAVLLRAEGFEVVAQVGDAEALLEAVERHLPEVAVGRRRDGGSSSSGRMNVPPD